MGVEMFIPLPKITVFEEQTETIIISLDGVSSIETVDINRGVPEGCDYRPCSSIVMKTGKSFYIDLSIEQIKDIINGG